MSEVKVGSHVIVPNIGDRYPNHTALKHIFNRTNRDYSSCGASSGDTAEVVQRVIIQRSFSADTYLLLRFNGGEELMISERKVTPIKTMSQDEIEKELGYPINIVSLK